jgi:hypothetical protein
MIGSDDFWVCSFYPQVTHRQEGKQRNQHVKSDGENKMNAPLSRTALLSPSAPAMSPSSSTSGGKEKRRGLSGLLP